MKLGFVSAILPECSLREVMTIAHNIGYDCVELMCWPKGKAERRYAGVTHIDVSNLTAKRIDEINTLVESSGVVISGLGYYPNPLVSDQQQRNIYVNHIKDVISAAARLGVNQMNTFVGRDHTKTVDQNWPYFLVIWKEIIEHAEQKKVRVGIENCPMLFTDDEWPGGKNLASSPSIWRRMFEEIPSEYFGLNYDPSHMILQHMNYLDPLHEFADKMFHMHAKDVRIDTGKLNDLGVFANPNKWHSPKLPGLGDIDWGKFFSFLTDSGFDGHICVEVEDRAYEGSIEKRKAALVQCHTYLRQFIPKVTGLSN